MSLVPSIVYIDASYARVLYLRRAPIYFWEGLGMNRKALSRVLYLVGLAFAILGFIGIFEKFIRMPSLGGWIWLMATVLLLDAPIILDRGPTHNFQRS